MWVGNECGGLIIGDLCFVLLWNWIELNTIVFGFQWGRRWGRIVRVLGRRGRRREGSWNPAKVKMEDAIINFNLNFVVVSSSSSSPPSSWSPYLFLLRILSLTVLEFCRLILLVIMGSYIRAQFVEANFITFYFTFYINFSIHYERWKRLDLILQPL